MFAYVIRRMFSGLIMLVVVSFVTFLLFFNGAVDPVRFTCGKACTPTVLETNRKTLGFDDPVPVQYGKFVKGIFVGRNYPDDPELAKTSPETIARCDAPCLGYSPQQSATVTSVIGDKIPVSVSLAIAAFILWIVFGVLFGVIAALNKGKFLDKLLVGGSLLFFAFPTFWIGSFAYRFIAVRWELLPVPEYVSIADGGVGAWALGLFLPALTLALFYMAGYVRITRAYVLESMSEDYLRTAKAKGLQPRKILWKHTMRAALTPLVTIAGLDFAALLGGAIITESVFNYDGLGKLARDAATTWDLPITVGIVLLLATFVIIANIIVDVLYAVIDPRVKYV